MKRNIVWLKDSGKLAECLVAPDRNAELQRFIGDLVENRATLGQVVDALNERGDLTDNEWTAAIFAIGVYVGSSNLA